MAASATALSYRRAAVQEASPAGLVVILYDLLIEDLQRASQAMRRAAIEERSNHLKHGLLVLQILEGTLDAERGGDAARSLAAFYAHIRSQLLEAQFRCDTNVLERQIVLLLEVREAWCSAESGWSDGHQNAADLPNFEACDLPEQMRWSA